MGLTHRCSEWASSPPSYSRHSVLGSGGPRHRLGSILGLFALLCGCGEDTATMTSPPSPISLSGVLTHALTGDGIPDAQICITATEARCTSTDDLGEYTISVPAETEVLLVLSAPDFITARVPVTSGKTSTTLRGVALLGVQVQRIQDTLIGVESLSTRGSVVFSISNGVPGDGVNIPDILVALDPPAGEGPFYTNAGGLPDIDLMTTSPHGGGLFVNVPPGDYEVRFEALPEGCFILFGWGEPAGVRFPIVAGDVTIIRIECA
jgi:hypothetical protein